MSLLDWSVELVVKRRVGLVVLIILGSVGLLALMVLGGRSGNALAEAPSGSPPPDGEPIGSMMATGHFGGVMKTVFVRNDYAYVGMGQELRIFDISNPSLPEVVGSIVFVVSVEDIVLSGNYAYLAVGTGGLFVVNISDPTAPILVGAENTPGFAHEVTVSNNLAFVADDFSGLRVINVSSPTAPTEVGFLKLPTRAMAVEVRGNFVYVAAGQSGLQVVNISVSDSPVLVGSEDTIGFSADVVLEGNYAYVADGQNSGLQVIDISSPVNPFGVAGLITPGEAQRIFIDGSEVYLSDGSGGLRIMDVSSPAMPTEIGSFDTGGVVEDAFVLGGVAFVVDEEQGLYLVDPSILPTPMLLSHYQNLLNAGGGIEAKDQYLYVGNDSRLAVLDISNPNLPEMVSHVVLSGTVMELVLVNDVAYVALGSEGLALVDISNPISLTLSGWIDTPGFANDVFVVNDLAYVADFDGGLRIIDVSVAASPMEVAFFQTAGDVYGVAVRNNFVFLADGPGGFRVLQVINLNNIQEIGFIPTPNSARDVHVLGSFAYVADGGGGLRIINVVNPFLPFQVGSVPLFGYGRGVTVLGDYAYVSAENGGLRLVDVSDVTASMEVSEYNTPGHTVDIALDNRGYAYIADSFAGIYVVTADLAVYGRVTDHNFVGFEAVAVEGTAERTAVSAMNGSYTMTGFLPDQTYNLTPTLAGFAFWPPNRSFMVDDESVSGQDFIILPEAVSTVVATNTQTVLDYLDVRGFPTEIEFGAGAVSETTAVTVTPIYLGGAGELAFAGHGFDMTAVQGGNDLAVFDQPVNINISYSDIDISRIVAEDALVILWWNGASWQDAAETCGPTSVYSRDLTNNEISLGVCRSGRYGLFGEAIRIYMPVMRKT